MLYYKAKTHDIVLNKGFKTIKNELFTQNEIENLNISDKKLFTNFDIYITSKRNTYFMFGARFETRILK